MLKVARLGRGLPKSTAFEHRRWEEEGVLGAGSQEQAHTYTPKKRRISDSFLLFTSSHFYFARKYFDVHQP